MINVCLPYVSALSMNSLNMKCMAGIKKKHVHTAHEPGMVYKVYAGHSIYFTVWMGPGLGP